MKNKKAYSKRTASNSNQFKLFSLTLFELGKIAKERDEDVKITNHGNEASVLVKITSQELRKTLFTEFEESIELFYEFFIYRTKDNPMHVCGLNLICKKGEGYLANVEVSDEIARHYESMMYDANKKAWEHFGIQYRSIL